MMLTTEEFATHWGVAPKTVRRWIRDERVHAEQPYPGAPFRIPEEELFTFRAADARHDSRGEAKAHRPRLQPWRSARQPKTDRSNMRANPSVMPHTRMFDKGGKR